MVSGGGRLEKKTTEGMPRGGDYLVLWRLRRCLRGRGLLRMPLPKSSCWNSSDVAVVAMMPAIARWERPDKSNRFASAA